MIDVLICISLLCCIIGFTIVTIDYMKTRNIYNLSKEDYKKLIEKEKERDDYYGLFH